MDITMGKNYAPLPTYLILHTYEEDFLQGLFNKKNKKKK